MTAARAVTESGAAVEVAKHHGGSCLEKIAVDPNALAERFRVGRLSLSPDRHHREMHTGPSTLAANIDFEPSRTG